MKIALLVLGIAAMSAIAWPLVSAVAGGGDNKATKLVHATERTENKAQDVSHTYDEIIPPAPANPPHIDRNITHNPQGRGTASGAAAPGEAGEADQEGEPAPTPTRDPRMSQAEHAVADAMEFLARVDAELGPAHTEYTMAVDRLKRAWSPRYRRAVDEYRRFEERVNHAEKMAFEYLELQQNLTQTVTDRELRRTHEERDAHEQIVILDWINQANSVLAQAHTIKIRLDDMNVSITKLELSATFASVYEGFVRMPIAITLLNEELDRFQQESEQIYETFGAKAGK